MKKRALGIVVLVAGMCFTVQAADFYKADNTTALLTGSSWIGGIAPPADFSSMVYFSSNTGTRTVSAGVFNHMWNGIIITNSAYKWTINAGSAIRIGSGGITLASGNGGDFQVDSIKLASNQIWNVADSARTLTVNGMLTNNNTASRTPVLTKTGAGTLTLNGGTNYIAGLTVSDGTVNLNGISTNAISGGALAILVNGGTLNANVVNSLGGGVEGITVNGGTLVAKTNNAFSGGVTINNGGTVTSMAVDSLGTGTITINNGGTLGATGNGNKTLTNSVVIGAGNATLFGNIGLSNSVTGSGSITHSGNTSLFNLTLNGNNSGFSGNITNNAIVTVGHKNALGTGTMYLNDQAALQANTALTGANALTNTIIISGTGKFGGSSDFELTGGISGNALDKSGVSIVTLSHANSYTGGTQVSLGTLIGNAADAFGTGDLTVGLAGTNTIATLTLNGAYMNDLAMLILGTNSVLNLNFSGSDTVGGIIIDGVNIGHGTFTSAQLDALGLGTVTGTGSMTVIPEPATIGMLGLGALVTLLVRRMRTAYR